MANSSVGRTSTSYAVCLTCGGAACSVLWSKPSVLLALFWTLLICGCHDNVVLMVTPGSPGCQTVVFVGSP